ncbi:Pvc16 family protein [Nonomuraea longicatena]|uniref:Pvc16 N-terminal domain-containing protein n=1 Tax=Nonomuraea longicatena TaxID=83682 RepID=A0ABN1NV28_9ACTN
MSTPDGVVGEAGQALRELVGQVLPGVPVMPGLPPDEGDAASVHVYLYDVREDLGRRRHGVLNELDAKGVVTARRRPPRYVSLSYLVMAWAPEPEEEYRLLGALLGGLLARESVPAELLTGSLAALALPVALVSAGPPREDRLAAEIVPQPFVNVMISAPIMAELAVPAAPLVKDPLDLHAEGLG